MFNDCSAADILGLPPADCLWVIALHIAEAGAPSNHVLALRRIAERLDDLGWWINEGFVQGLGLHPLATSEAEISPRMPLKPS
jgi:hypothetical protein